MMRISIWQQWASNHSAAFTVMGKFSTVDEAQRVGGILKHMLVEIARWKHQESQRKWQAYLAEHQIQHPTPADFARFEEATYDPDPTPVEIRLGEQYGISWPQTLAYARDPVVVPEAVKIVDRAVIVAEDFIDFYTWTGYWPMDELMRKFGGEVGIFCEFGESLHVTVRCTAPDDATATELAQQVQHRVKTYGPETCDEIYIAGLAFEGKPVSEWVPGKVSSQGLTLSYAFEEWHYGRAFASLIAHVQALGCTDIDYTFESKDLA